MAEKLQYAGQVDIKSIFLNCRDQSFDIREFLVELNYYEDMFSNFIYGDILISDSFNLIEQGPIVGEETIQIEFQTPGKRSIAGTYFVYKVSSRKIVRDNNTQLFVLHFISREGIKDMIAPLSKVYEGPIDSIVKKVFNEELKVSANIVIPHSIENKAKLIPCQWSPSRLINYLASKSIPSGGVTARNVVFFQTNRDFYFSSIEYFIKQKKYFGSSKNEPFTLAAVNIKDPSGNSQSDILREYRMARDVEMVDMPDKVQQLTNGHLSNRLITLDFYNKQYKVTDYDYQSGWSKFAHTGPVKFYDKAASNPATNISFYPKQPKLFDNFQDNTNEKIDVIYPQRKAIMHDYRLCNLIITVPGQTDIEVGNFIYFYYPQLKPVNSPGSDRFDKRYTGDFLVTSIRHKVNLQNHTMILELTRDGLNDAKYL